MKQLECTRNLREEDRELDRWGYGWGWGLFDPMKRFYQGVVHSVRYET